VETSGGDGGNIQTHGGLTGLHNTPTGCSAPGAYAPGPGEEKKKGCTNPGRHIALATKFFKVAPNVGAQYETFFWHPEL
jgi:hypothetical protein